MSAESGTEQQEQGEQQNEAQTPAEPAQEAAEQDKSYDEEYVKNLRDEAAAARVKAKRAEEAESRLRNYAIASAVQGILTQPDDLIWNDAYCDADGWPDPAKILAAAEELVERKPYLGRPAGDVGQGRHSSKQDESATSILGRLLKAGA